jgi:membrane protein required for colicin V production
MNWLDYVLCVLAAVFAVHGAMRGFTRQIIGLAAILIGLLLACWFYGTAGAFLLPYVSHKGVANFIGFLLVFVGVQITGGIIGWAIFRLLKTVGLSFIDRALGVAFGLLKAALVGVVLVVALSSFTMKQLPDGVSGSRFAPVLMEVGRLVSAMTPKEMKDVYDRSYQNLKKLWEEKVRPEIEKKVKDGGALPGASG